MCRYVSTTINTYRVSNVYQWQLNNFLSPYSATIVTFLHFKKNFKILVRSLQIKIKINFCLVSNHFFTVHIIHCQCCTFNDSLKQQQCALIVILISHSVAYFNSQLFSSHAMCLYTRLTEFFLNCCYLLNLAFYIAV